MPTARILAVPLLLIALPLAGCHPAAKRSPFPDPARPVAPVVSAGFSTEDARDKAGEFETVAKLADVAPGMTVADIGAGEGYYTVRLSPLVGAKGRVLAEDIVPETRDFLARRVTHDRLDNVAVRLGHPNDPLLPDGSFDRVFMIHMYHEIERPSEFLWHVRSALRPDGRIILVDADRPTAQHGTPPKLLICEFGAVGYRLTRFERLPKSGSYFAQFEANGPRPQPQDIPVCPG